MAGRAQQRQGDRLLGYNIIEPVNLDTGVAEIRVGGTVLELVAGNGQLLCDDAWMTARPGVMLTIPKGSIHRAQGGNEDLVILEVQHGEVLNEDDIERLQDDYGRVIT